MALSPEAIQSRLRSGWKLYTLPQTLLEIIKIAGAEDSSTGDLTRIILRDPPLTVKLLKLANSAIYGRPQRVATVNQAVVLLGFRAVKSLALSTSVYDLFSAQAGFLEKQLKRFWRHCLETAVYAQLFAARTGYPVQEEAFIGGLLHDLGLIVLASVFPEQYRDLWNKPLPEGGIAAAEDQELGINHAEAAACLFADWGLPEILVDAVRYHHLAGKSDELHEMDKLTLLVALSDMMGRHQLEPSSAAEGGTVDEKYRLAQSLQLNAGDLRDVDSWVTANLSTIAAYLDIDIGSPIEVLCEANDRLFELFLEVEGLHLNRCDSVRRDVANEKGKIAAEVLRVVSATFSHYINNATTTIMGHAQLIEMALQKGQITDTDGRISAAMKTIQNSVINITAILDELKATPTYNVVSYHERCKILDVESQVRRRITQLLDNIHADRSPTTTS